MTDSDPTRPEWATKLLDPTENLSGADVKAAIMNALKRIEAIERELDGLCEAFRWFNDSTSALGPR